MPTRPRAGLAVGLAAGLAVVLAAGLACSRQIAEPSPIASERPVSISLDVASQSDLLAARAAYLERAAAGFSGRLELRFTASLPATSWSLQPEDGAVPRFELVLRGDGAVIPLPDKLVARSVRLEGLVLTGAVAESSVIEVERAAELRGCAFLDGRTTLPSRAPYLLVRAHGVRGVPSPATLTVAGTWFVGNEPGERDERGAPGSPGAALFATQQHERDGGYFETVRFSDCAFLGNGFSAELSLANALEVSFARCLLVKTAPSGVLLDAGLVASVTVADSTVLVGDLARVAKLGRDVPPVAFLRSHLYAADYHADKSLPAELMLTRSLVTSSAAVAEQLAPIQAAARMPVAMPPAELRQQLMQALHP